MTNKQFLTYKPKEIDGPYTICTLINPFLAYNRMDNKTLAKMLECSPVDISNLKAWRKNPCSKEKRKRISIFFKLPVEYLNASHKKDLRRFFYNFKERRLAKTEEVEAISNAIDREENIGNFDSDIIYTYLRKVLAVLIRNMELTEDMHSAIIDSDLKNLNIKNLDDGLVRIQMIGQLLSSTTALTRMDIDNSLDNFRDNLLKDVMLAVNFALDERSSNTKVLNEAENETAAIFSGVDEETIPDRAQDKIHYYFSALVFVIPAVLIVVYTICSGLGLPLGNTQIIFSVFFTGSLMVLFDIKKKKEKKDQ